MEAGHERAVSTGKVALTSRKPAEEPPARSTAAEHAEAEPLAAWAELSRAVTARPVLCAPASPVLSAPSTRGCPRPAAPAEAPRLRVLPWQVLLVRLGRGGAPGGHPARDVQAAVLGHGADRVLGVRGGSLWSQRLQRWESPWPLISGRGVA